MLEVLVEVFYGKVLLLGSDVVVVVDFIVLMEFLEVVFMYKVLELYVKWLVFLLWFDGKGWLFMVECDGVMVKLCLFDN